MNSHSESAFEEIVARYRAPLERYVSGFLPQSRVEDVVQETFLAAWQALDRGEDVRDHQSWLYTIAHNRAIDAQRRNGYDYAELKPAHASVLSSAAESEERARVRDAVAAVGRLPERQRQALVSTALDGKPEHEVARALGISGNAVRQLVHRARSTLRGAVAAIAPAPLVPKSFVAAVAVCGIAAAPPVVHLAQDLERKDRPAARQISSATTRQDADHAGDVLPERTHRPDHRKKPDAAVDVPKRPQTPGRAHIRNHNGRRHHDSGGLRGIPPQRPLDPTPAPDHAVPERPGSEAAEETYDEYEDWSADESYEEESYDEYEDDSYYEDEYDFSEEEEYDDSAEDEYYEDEDDWDVEER